MRLFRRISASVAALSVAASVAVAAPRLVADLTGKWTVNIASPQGDLSTLMEVTQKADSITGTFQSQLGSAPIAGIVKGDSVFFVLQLDMGGQQLAINGAGLVKDKDSWGGQLEVSGFGAMPFSAVRQP
jgi:hypothetical protein